MAPHTSNININNNSNSSETLESMSLSQSQTANSSLSLLQSRLRYAFSEVVNIQLDDSTIAFLAESFNAGTDSSDVHHQVKCEDFIEQVEPFLSKELEEQSVNNGNGNINYSKQQIKNIANNVYQAFKISANNMGGGVIVNNRSSNTSNNSISNQNLKNQINNNNHVVQLPPNQANTGQPQVVQQNQNQNQIPIPYRNDASSSSAASSDQNDVDSYVRCQVAGLGEWLASVRLERYQRAAESWATREGAVELAEVFENLDDFCQQLQLTNIEKNRVSNWARDNPKVANGEIPFEVPKNKVAAVTPATTAASGVATSTVASTVNPQQQVNQIPPQAPSQNQQMNQQTQQPQQQQQQPHQVQRPTRDKNKPVLGLPLGFSAEKIFEIATGPSTTTGTSTHNLNPTITGSTTASTVATNTTTTTTGYADVQVVRTKTPLPEGDNLTFGCDNDPYVQLDELGSGAMATVYRCYKRSNPDLSFAVKVISLKKLRMQGGFNREYNKLQREAQILSSLRNRYITALIDVIEQRNNLHLVMEQVKHGELFESILDHNNEPYVARFSEPEARYVFVQIAAGLQYVHAKQIVHRDLKPENILVAEKVPLISEDFLKNDRRWNTLMECNRERTSRMIAYHIKLSDFGLAKLVADGYSIACTRTGTPQYWAPEVATAHRGAPQNGNPTNPDSRTPHAARQGYTFSADLWSLGVVLYVMLAGRYPFTGTPQQMEEAQTRASYEFPRRCGLSNEVKYLITNLVRKEPKKRMSLINCLRCKWSTKSMMMTKCQFFKQKIPLQHWNARRILLPLMFDNTTAAIMSTLFRSFPINLDENGQYNNSHNFPGIPDSLEPGVPEVRVADNIRMLDAFKQKIWHFINESGIDDIVDYEIDSYGNRYFFLNFRYLLESSSDVLWIKKADEPPQNNQNQTLILKPKTFKQKPTDYGVTKASDSKNFVYSRREDVIAFDLLYTVLPQVFGVCRILEMVPLFLKQIPNPEFVKGAPNNAGIPETILGSHGLHVSDANKENNESGSTSTNTNRNTLNPNPNDTSGLLVESVDEDSPMFARIFPGDYILEIMGQPIKEQVGTVGPTQANPNQMKMSAVEFFQTHAKRQGVILLVQRAI